MKKNIVYCILFVLLVLGCDKKEKNTMLFVGAYRSLDRVIPYPFLLQQTKDSISFFNYKGEILDKKLQDTIQKNDTVLLSDKKFLILKHNEEKVFLFDLLDTVNFRVYEDRSPVQKDGAFMLTSEQKITSESLKKIQKKLENSIWTYDVIEDENDNPNEDFKIQKKYSFVGDVVTELTTYYYHQEEIISEYQNLNYHLFKIDNKSFLSFSKTEDNPQPIFQILSTTNSEIELRDYSSYVKKDKKITFQKNNLNPTDYLNLLNKSEVYENCFDGFQGQYYHTSPTIYKKGNEFLINYVKANFSNVQLNENGYVILHFNINCKNKIGDFGLIQMTRNFKKTMFSKELIKHIVHKIKVLKDWSDVVPEKWSSYKDEHAFLMFKIENGKITDVCP